MSHPTARHQRPSRRSPAPHDPYDEGQYGHGLCRVAVDDGVRYDDGGYQEAVYERASFEQAWRDRPFLDQVPHQEARYQQTRYGDGFYDDGAYQEARYEQTQYGDGFYDDGAYQEASSDQALYDQGAYDHGAYGHGAYDDARYDDASYQQEPDAGYRQDPDEETRFDEARSDEAPPARPERPAPARRKPGAHRHARPSRKRRKPVRIAAAMAGSTLLVAGAVPATAHWWHRPATNPDADKASLPTTPAVASGAQTSGQSTAPQNALDQWAQIPIGKHVAAEAKVAQRGSKPAVKSPAPQPSRSRQPQPPPQPAPAAAYQNPLRAVDGLILERVDMGVDFGGAGPVYALGDGVITNATGDSSGWPGGGWITYQLTDGPDSGLVVYVAEDVKPTVEVGQKVTSSTVIADMFNGGDGIETGWATSDGSTAESQMAAAGGIGGNGPFPTMVGLSFDAVLESVGVGAAPNADQAGSGLLPAGYPPVPN